MQPSTGCQNNQESYAITAEECLSCGERHEAVRATVLTAAAPDITTAEAGRCAPTPGKERNSGTVK